MPTLHREKVWPFTLLAAVVSTLGSMAPTGGPRCACRVRWGCIIVVSPRWRILVSECQGIFSTVPIPIANEEQKENREKRGGGGKSVHISICEMCQTLILFAQCNNSLAKTNRGGTDLFGKIKDRFLFIYFLNFPKSYLDLIVLIALQKNIWQEKMYMFLNEQQGAGGKTSTDLHSLWY